MSLGGIIKEFVGNTPHRTDYIQSDDHFMGEAMLSAMRSKDPNTQVGACIVNKRNRIVGTGYNGWPSGVEPEEFPWDRESSLPLHETKYAYVVHAERNAILNATRRLKNARIYVTMAPCNECALEIVQSGIREVVYLTDPYHFTPKRIAARNIFAKAKKPVKERRYIPPAAQLVIDYETLIVNEKESPTGPHAQKK